MNIYQNNFLAIEARYIKTELSGTMPQINLENEQPYDPKRFLPIRLFFENYYHYFYKLLTMIRAMGLYTMRGSSLKQCWLLSLKRGVIKLF